MTNVPSTTTTVVFTGTGTSATATITGASATGESAAIALGQATFNDIGSSGPYTVTATNLLSATVTSGGDCGAPPSYPSVSPNVVSVGDTSLYLTSQNTYGSESGWGNASLGWGSGGGISAIETQPAYQKGVVRQSSSYRPPGLYQFILRLK